MVAEKHSLRLIPLLDPYADLPLASQSLAREGLTVELIRMEALSLLSRGVGLHYPTLVGFRCGQLLDTVLPGYTSPQHIERFLHKQQIIE